MAMMSPRIGRGRYRPNGRRVSSLQEHACAGTVRVTVFPFAFWTPVRRAAMPSMNCGSAAAEPALLRRGLPPPHPRTVETRCKSLVAMPKPLR